MDLREALLHDIEAFVAERGMAETTFGRKAVNDGKFVPRIRSGKPIGIDLAQRARRFIASEQARMETERATA